MTSFREKFFLEEFLRKQERLKRNEEKVLNLKKHWNTFDMEEKKDKLLDAWKSQSSSAKWGYEWWVSLFKETGFITNCGANQPTEEIILYRGCKPKVKRGMPWTNDYKTAKYFAERKKTTNCSTYIYTTKVKPESILGIIQGKVDPVTYITEYIVNYQDLTEKQIEIYDHSITPEGKLISQIIRMRDEGGLSIEDADFLLKFYT